MEDNHGNQTTLISHDSILIARKVGKLARGTGRTMGTPFTVRAGRNDHRGEPDVEQRGGRYRDSRIGAYGACAIRSIAETGGNSMGEWSGWTAALAGLWIGVSPFLLSGEIPDGTPMWSTVGAGLIAMSWACTPAISSPRASDLVRKTLGSDFDFLTRPRVLEPAGEHVRPLR